MQANVWLNALSGGTYESVEQLAGAADLHPKVVRNRIQLAFLAPNIVKEVLCGGKSGVQQLAESIAWSDQNRVLQRGNGQYNSAGQAGAPKN